MRNTIKKHSDFQMSPDAPIARTPFCIAKARRTKFTDGARYGLMVTKRTMKLATDRNRAKRLMRVWLLACESDMNPDTDYVFIIRKSILDTNMTDGIAALRRAFNFLNKSND